MTTARRSTPTRSLENSKQHVIQSCPIADPNFVKNDFDCSSLAVADIAETEVTSLDATVLPGSGRNVTATLDNAGASTCDISITVRGRDIHGQTVSETLTGLTKAAGIVTGLVIFKEIDQAVVPIGGVAVAGASGDVLDVGFGDDIGMLHVPAAVDDNEIYIERDNGGTRVIVAASTSTVDLSYRKYKAIGSGSAGIIAAGDTFEIFTRLDYDSPDDRDFIGPLAT